MGARATIAVCLVDVVRHQIALLIIVAVAVVVALLTHEDVLELAQPARVSLQRAFRLGDFHQPVVTLRIIRMLGLRAQRDYLASRQARSEGLAVVVCHAASVLVCSPARARARFIFSRKAVLAQFSLSLSLRSL